MFEAYNAMTPGAFMLLTEKDRMDFHSTAKWHFGQRMAFTSLKGMTVGGKSLDEIASEKKG